MFNLCSFRVFVCSPEEPGRFLDVALAEGQSDAIRSEAIALLIGDTGDAVHRFGFARHEDTDRALALFQQAATPVAGASRNPMVTLYDNMSAGYLSYFYWGGQYRGRTLVDLNPITAQQYGQGCTGGMTGITPLSEFCGMIDAVGRFNTATDVNTRNTTWSFIQQFVPWAPVVGPLARNLATWSKDGSGIDRLSCDLSDDLRFSPPPTRPTTREGVAYCYFPKPTYPYPRMPGGH